MATLFYDRVKAAVSGTPGTGNITLGAASTGYQSFSGAGVVNGALVSYVIEDGGSWEFGHGTYSTTGPTLTRTTVLGSSAGGTTKISASSSATVAVTLLAEDITTFLTAAATISTTLWRVLFKKVSAAFIALETFEFHNTVGGSAVIPPTYTMDTSFSGNPASNLFDNNSGTAWASSGTTNQSQLDATFSTAQSFGEISVTNRNTGEGPDSIVVQASLDGGTTYITVATLACATWGSSMTQTFGLPTTTGSSSPLANDSIYYRATDLVKPTSALFTNGVEMSAGIGASASDTSRGMFFKVPATLPTLKQAILTKALPSTPYTVKVLGHAMGNFMDYSCWGLVHADSSNKNIMYDISGNNTAGSRFDIQQNSALGSYNADTAYMANTVNVGINTPVWLKLQDDGTNVFFSYSLDGEHWRFIHSQSRTAYLTPTKLGLTLFCGTPTDTAGDLGVHVLSYSETAGLV